METNFLTGNLFIVNVSYLNSDEGKKVNDQLLFRTDSFSDAEHWTQDELSGFPNLKIKSIAIAPFSEVLFTRDMQDDDRFYKLSYKIYDDDMKYTKAICLIQATSTSEAQAIFSKHPLISNIQVESVIETKISEVYER